MRHAIVKENKVINVIEYDPDKIESDQAEYDEKLADYRAGHKEWVRKMNEYGRKQAMAMKKARAEALKIRKEKGPQSMYMVPIEEIERPAPLVKPKQPAGLFIPPADCQLVPIPEDQVCGIGYIYRNGEFEKPREEE